MTRYQRSTVPSTADTRSMRMVVLPFCCVLAAACFGAAPGDAWNAPPFSADLVNLHDGSRTSTHLDVGVGKLRMVSADNGKTTAFVFDPEKHTLLVIDDQAKTYIDAGMFSSMVAGGMAPMLRLFRPAADGDPCTTWNGTVNQFASFAKQSGPPPHFSCTPMGSDAVNGRAAHKWSVATTGGNETSEEPSTVWIDDRLHIITKSIDPNGSMEMQNVREGQPSADLFDAPASYQKMGVTDFLASLAKGAGASTGSGTAPSSSSPDQSAGGDVRTK
jgi:hypothetical protein